MSSFCGAPAFSTPEHAVSEESVEQKQAEPLYGWVPLPPVPWLCSHFTKLVLPDSEKVLVKSSAQCNAVKAWKGLTTNLRVCFKPYTRESTPPHHVESQLPGFACISNISPRSGKPCRELSSICVWEAGSGRWGTSYQSLCHRPRCLRWFHSGPFHWLLLLQGSRHRLWQWRSQDTHHQHCASPTSLFLADCNERSRPHSADVWESKWVWSSPLQTPSNLSENEPLFIQILQVLICSQGCTAYTCDALFLNSPTPSEVGQDRHSCHI